jgi:hypothetical protein
VRCPVCGTFALSRPPEDEDWIDTLDDVDRGALAGVLRSRVERHERAATVLRKVDVRDLILRSGRPGNVDDLVSHALSLIARLAPGFGGLTEWASWRVWASRFFLFPAGAGEKLLRVLEQDRLLKVWQNPDDQIEWAVELTLRGWEEYHRRQRRGMDSTTVFIATWGDLVMDPAVAALCSAAREAGLEPTVGNQLAGQNRITEDIEAAIRRSRLLIADFTGARAAVSWEAGFARGLGLPVIYTCHGSWTGEVIERDEKDASKAPWIAQKPWREQRQFDTTQFPHLWWESPEELKAKVLSKIRAEGWDEPSRRPAT